MIGPQWTHKRAHGPTRLSYGFWPTGRCKQTGPQTDPQMGPYESEPRIFVPAAASSKQKTYTGPYQLSYLWNLLIDMISITHIRSWGDSCDMQCFAAWSMSVISYKALCYSPPCLSSFFLWDDSRVVGESLRVFGTLLRRVCGDMYL